MEAFRSPSPALDDMLDLEAFEAELKGSIVLPGSVDYDEARQVQSAQYDRRPALIVRAADAGDVARTVNLARESGLTLSVRGGAHSLAGYGTNDGGIVLDLGGMKGLLIDPEARTAWAQPGLTAGEYTVAAAAHGLATPFGDTGSVGIGGLTLGGGIGWLVRKYGMTIDSLLAVEIVTADGRQVTASPDSHPDLFWAVRGGGGNFGVVTRFQFRLHPVGQILGGALFLPPTREALRNLVPLSQAAPEELTTIAFLMPLPPGCARFAGRSGSGSPRGAATCGPSVSLIGRPASGRPAGRATGGSQGLRSSSGPCPSATGPISVWWASAIGLVASGSAGKPPDADPHVRWCGRGRCDAAPSRSAAVRQTLTGRAGRSTRCTLWCWRWIMCRSARHCQVCSVPVPWHTPLPE